MGFLLWDLKKHIKSALKKSHNLPHNGPFLPHNFPWKCRRISHFLPHPIRSPVSSILSNLFKQILNGSILDSYSSVLCSTTSIHIFRKFWKEQSKLRLESWGIPFSTSHLLLTNFWQACTPYFSSE